MSDKSNILEGLLDDDGVIHGQGSENLFGDASMPGDDSGIETISLGNSNPFADPFSNPFSPDEPSRQTVKDDFVKDPKISIADIIARPGTRLTFRSGVFSPRPSKKIG